MNPYDIDSLRHGLDVPTWVPTALLALLAMVAKWLRARPCTLVGLLTALPGSVVAAILASALAQYAGIRSDANPWGPDLHDVVVGMASYVGGDLLSIAGRRACAWAERVRLPGESDR